MNISPQALYRWYGNTLRNPKYRWWIILGTLVYLLSPLDISPDLIPIVGQVDDFLILTVLLTEVFQLITNATPKKSFPSEEENIKTVDVDAVSLD
jgi:uncharacterized membrane protein YkvA (DUF1232 family)